MRLSRDKLHVVYLHGVDEHGPIHPRRYTLTHSDRTGELFLTIGPDYDRGQISGLYTRLMRDEVIAEWRIDENEPSLHVHCHVSGGLVFGRAAWRDRILRREMPLVLEALRCGDRSLYDLHPELDRSTIWVHFHSTSNRHDGIERWGTLQQYSQACASGKPQAS